MPRQVPTTLETSRSLGRLVPISATIGAACGALAGCLSLVLLTNASVAGALLGGVSSGVIGGLFGFLLASFVEIVRTSLREAIAAEEQQVPPRRPVASHPRRWALACRRDRRCFRANRPGWHRPRRRGKTFGSPGAASALRPTVSVQLKEFFPDDQTPSHP
jgi:hypothetical protein